MPQFNYIELESKPNNPMEGDLYYDKSSYVIYIYHNLTWINIDWYTDDFDSFSVKFNRKLKLKQLKKLEN